MAVYKNAASQKCAVFAVDATGAPKTGDAANITARISLDGGAVAQTNDANPTELDATHAKGVYLFDLTQAETNADLVIVTPVSGTSGVVLRPVIIYTEPALRTANAMQLAGQTITAAAGVTFPATVASPTNITAASGIALAAAQHVIVDSGTVTTVGSVTNDVGITQAAADKVWGTTARSLTTFGSLVADIATAVWASAARTLTAISDSSGITTLLSRILGTLAAGTHTAQTGDAYARIGAAGASLTALGDARLANLTDISTDAEIADAVLDALTDDHDADGTIGKAIGLAGSGGVDASALATAVASALTGQVTVTYPLSADGAVLTLKQGDSYTLAEGRHIAWASAAWANDLVASPVPAAIRLVATWVGRVTLSATCTATAARAVRLELTAAQTAALAAATHTFDLYAEWADGRVETLVSGGTLIVLPDYAV